MKHIYKNIRGGIKSGDLIAFTHREPWYKSWHDFKIYMVRMLTRSEYSHVATAWVTSGRVFIIEAVMPLVRIYPLSKAGEFEWYPLNAPWTDDIEEYALSIVGEEYSQIQAMQAPFGTPPSDNMWECAETFATISKKMGIVLSDIYTPTDQVRGAKLYGSVGTLVQDK